MKRVLFIKKVFVFLGITSTSPLFLSSCEVDVSEEETALEEELSEEEQAYLNLKEITKENGFFLEGKLLYIDITNDLYSKLQNTGEFINDSDHYVLLLRKTDETVLAYSNCCPHLGTSNRWSYSNESFRCTNHGNSYGTGSGFIANCSSNNTSGNLKQYTTLLNQDILTVDFDS
jgi:nitrite reductase/ring-hydroxylating ferredoxin subunit